MLSWSGLGSVLGWVIKILQVTQCRQKNKRFYLSEDTIKRVKQQPTKWETIYANPISVKGLVFRLYWRRQWHPTPVLLPGKSHGRRSLVGCSPWGRKDSDMTERLHFHFSLFTFMHWRRKWQPTPVFLPGESQGQGSLVGCHLWGHTELHTTEVT